jgi:hypothetical protein
MRSFFTFSIIAALGAGCVADSAQNNSLVLLKNQAPDANCNVAGADNGTFIGAGILDIADGDAYFMTPLIELRTEVFDSNDPLARSVTIQGAEVSIDGFDTFSERFSVVMPPNSSIGALIRLVDRADMNVAAGDSLLAEVVVFGETAGSSVESNTFDYPIDVCDGCLRSGETTPCTSFQAPDGELCFPGQDSFGVACCTDSAGTLQCPGFLEPPPA